MDAMDEIVREFVVESYENLDQLDQDLVALESDSSSRALLSSVFRTIHTIKGTSGFLAFGNLESLTHVGENLLAELRDGKRVMTQLTADVLLKMVDSVRDLLGVIESTGTEGTIDTSAIVAEIQAVLDDPTGGAGTETAAPAEPVDEAAAEEAIEAAVAALHEDDEDDADDADDVDEAPEAEAEVEPVAEKPAAEKPAPKIGKKIVAKPDTAPAKPAAPAAPAAAAKPAEETKTTEETPVRSAAEQSIRVDVDVLDALMRHVGELVLARNAMTNLAADMDDPALVRASQRLSLIATELQQGVMKTRMQPIDHVWNKVPRMVRDISSALGRKVRLDMVGKDTELDRGVLEAIKDPLTHLIRNAIDHGIETPADRAKAGKPEQGVLGLRAYHQGGQVVIEIADDGKGIDPDVISAKAIEKGLKTAGQIESMSPQDILQLLFLPGFSTAEKVTNVSGRGVGMDVVKTKIDSIGGVVDVQSTPGTGTTWRLRIPLTLAIMPALTVECADEVFAIPQVNLLELLAIDDKLTGIDHVGDAPVYRLRGQLLPLVDLRDVLGRDKRESLEGAVITVLQADGGRFGLLVDKVRNTEEIVAKPIATAIKTIGLYAGATLLGDGSVTLILDIPAVARRALELTETQIDVHDEAALRGDTEQMLVVAVGEGRQLAMPLGAVTRLERLSAEVLETVGGATVMQYRDRITPVVDLAQMLGSGAAFREELAFIICTRGDRTVALVANEVVDIVDSTAEERSEVSGYGLLGSIVVKDKVTELLDLEAAVTQADAAFYEVEEHVFNQSEVAELIGAGKGA
ncbi:chemotaxis protein CheW [Demequina zhanjiangensis]|uniref:histidine kinase n=1 Tax=Demequina zhanjiangensis TaxID=3051659 RepID=A0ABT8FZM8_9MICO|nr:chemotaxis protein CheW [Demequina sp. SYSU T00b26]MDN4472351.1 chemotaxis protein CheW [Demequina sp. SYSU T00b26]